MNRVPLDKKARITTWTSQIVAAAILGMAAPAKFMADPSAVAIFEKLGAEPMGRLATGGLEALAVILLLVPATSWMGGLLAGGLMVGALVSHLTVLGVLVDGSPSMFIMALVAFAASVTVIWIRRCELPWLGARCPRPSEG